MTSAGHRKPRGRTRRSASPPNASEAPELAEAIGSAVAPADVGPDADDELTPLDHDGLVPIAILTVAWGIAAVVLFLIRDDLAESDRTWWLWTCIAGFGLGLLGYAFSRRRRDLLRAKG